MQNSPNQFNRTLPQSNTPPSGSKGYVWLLLILLLGLLYFMRVIIGTVSYGFLSGIENTFRFSDSLSPFVSWVMTGLLAGAVCGAAIAVKKYHLEKKYILIPAGIALFLVVLCAVINKPFTEYVNYPGPVTATNHYAEPARTDTIARQRPEKPQKEQPPVITDTIPAPAPAIPADAEASTDTVADTTATAEPF